MKRVLLLLALAACGPARAPKNDAPSVAIEDGVAVVRASGSTPMGAVTDTLDRLKGSGAERYVLEIDGASRTGELAFPRAGTIDPRTPLMVFDLAHAGEATGGDVVLRAPPGAPLRDVVAAVRAAQAHGANVYFTMSPAAKDPYRPHPVAKTFVACPFPPAADAAKVDSAVVLLAIDVEASGKATAARIVGDPGLGFGEAAQTCALAATYLPATDRDGNPVAGSTRMRVRFER